MAASSTNLNIIYIPMIHRGCFNSQFDSNYPDELDGIINPDDFKQSITKINDAIGSSLWTRILIIICILCSLGGFVMAVIGGILEETSNEKNFFSLVAIGVGMMIFGIIFAFLACALINSRRVTRMRKAIALESQKYSMNSHKPSHWNLNRMKILSKRNENNDSTCIDYHFEIAIEIGENDTPKCENIQFHSNSVSFRSKLYFQEQEQIPPPPYPGLHTTFCSQCHAARQDLMAKFCSSCGHAFNV